MTFRGIPAEAFDFYARLEADNTKSFWQANKATFESDVKAPVQALCDELGEYGPFHLFRPYNDLRFAKGKPPYKTAQGAYGEGTGGAGYYVQVSADGLMVAAGYYAMAKDQLERFREAVDAEPGGTIELLAHDLERRGYSIGAIDELKSAPRGYPKDHPRIELLRRKGLMMSRSWAAASKVRKVWKDAAPMCEWLNRWVGPSVLPPPEASR